MGIYTKFPSGWWAILGIIYGLFLLALLLRKNKSKSEIGHQISLGFIVIFLASVIEFTAVSLGLWNYEPGNWPLPLIFAYFGIGPAGYQISKLVEEFKKNEDSSTRFY